MNTDILSATLPFFSDTFALFRYPNRIKPISIRRESVNLAKVVGIERDDFAGLSWGVLLRGQGAVRSPMTRLPASLRELKTNPAYYVSRRRKEDWSFFLVDGNYYISSGHIRTVIGRAFLELNGLEPVVHGVHVLRYDTQVWDAFQREPESEFGGFLFANGEV